MAGEVSSFFFREEKLQQEIEQEKHTYPELNLQIRTLIQERDVMKSIYRDTYNQKKGHQQDEYMHFSNFSIITTRSSIYSDIDFDATPTT